MVLSVVSEFKDKSEIQFEYEVLENGIIEVTDCIGSDVDQDI